MDYCWQLHEIRRKFPSVVAHGCACGMTKQPVTAVRTLNSEVLPFFEDGCKVETILSDNTRKYVGSLVGTPASYSWSWRRSSIGRRG